MKKAIVISLVALLVNSAGLFVSAQTLPPATEKDFTAAYDARVRQSIAAFPDLPGIAIVVIKDGYSRRVVKFNSRGQRHPLQPRIGCRS